MSTTARFGERVILGKKISPGKINSEMQQDFFNKTAFDEQSFFQRLTNPTCDMTKHLISELIQVLALGILEIQ